MKHRFWTDGRSGGSVQVAGELVLRHLHETTPIKKLVGTAFETPKEILLGRGCGTDRYLGGSRVHWANVSLSQHHSMSQRAKGAGKKFCYLCITLAHYPSPSSVHWWKFPGGIVEQTAQFRSKKLNDVFVLQVHRVGAGYYIEDVDVSQYHQELRIPPEFQAALAKARRKDPAPSVSVRNDDVREHDPIPNVAVASGSPMRKDHVIPLTSGHDAILSVPVPIPLKDVERIAAWIDLMRDVLTSESTKT